jgi:glucose-1-phosphate adenylyltransferase
MDVRQMIDAHVQADADVSVATLPIALDQCHAFGIVETDDRSLIQDFQEKPTSAKPMPGRPGHALASMGNYIFKTEVLMAELQRAKEAGESDFGKHILPRMVKTHRLLAYDFSTNEIPGVCDFEEPAYWRDVGTIDAYFEAHLDSLGARPRFRMTNPHWPIYASPDQSESAQIENGIITRSVVGSGCVVNGARLDHAMLRRLVNVEADAQLDHCIVMDRNTIGAGARLRRVIVDQDNHIPAGELIGHDLARDRERFTVSANGVVVVPRGYFRRRANP